MTAELRTPDGLPAEEAAALVGRLVVDHDGSRIGRLQSAYADPVDGAVRWLEARCGILTGRHVLVPAVGALLSGERIVTRYDKRTVRECPPMLVNADLIAEEELTLYRHYGLVTDRAHWLTGQPANRLTLVPAADLAATGRRPAPVTLPRGAPALPFGRPATTLPAL